MRDPKSANSSRTSRRQAAHAPDAVAVLIADHQAVKKMHRQYRQLMSAGAPATTRGALAAKICDALTAHTLSEEEIFYPALRSSLDLPSMMDEADVEHASAKDLISQIRSLEPNADKYDARVIVLCEHVDHHVREEEEEMFPKARRAKNLDMQRLGQRLLDRKDALQHDGTAARRDARRPKG